MKRTNMIGALVTSFASASEASIINDFKLSCNGSITQFPAGEFLDIPLTGEGMTEASHFHPLLG
jgi:hypothetical protein